MRCRFAVALLAVAAWAVPTFADTSGPPFGANKYTSSIDTVMSVEDTDDFVASLLTGETLTVKLSANKLSALLPALSLIAPDGRVIPLTPPAVAEKKDGTIVFLRKFGIATAGRWTVRVSGKNGTQGAYTIAFKIGTALGATLTRQHLGGGDPMSRDVPVDGVDGALLDMTVRWPKSSSAIHIGAVKDPSGAENTTGAPPAEKPGSAKLADRVLRGGDGRYTVNLSIASGEATYSVTTEVTPPTRPKSKAVAELSSSEPFLDIRTTPMRGDAGLTARLTGVGFPRSPAPRVLFGGVEGTGVVVAADGRSLDVVVPPGAAGSSTVDVTVVQADGQASLREDYFRYVPRPTITDLTNVLSQHDPGGTSAGGEFETLVGTGFLPGHVVRFGTQDAVGAAFVDSAHFDLRTPAIAAGMVSITVEDEFARIATSPFQFEFKDPPAFAAAPFSPPVSPRAGGATVTITGSAFESTDQLRFNGANINSTFFSATTRRFVTPALPTGFYSVQIVDRFGLTGSGPDFPVKDPPVFANSPYLPPVATTAGGTTVTISGSGFEAADQLRFNGSNIISTFVNSTTRRFVPPAMAAGVYSVELVERFGLVVTGPSFEIKDPPTFAASPYSPVVAPTAGGTTLTITGSGFEAADRFGFNGMIVSSTFVDSTTRRYVLPAMAAGSYAVSLIDRFDRVTTGPSYPIKDAPAFAASPYSPVGASTAGGTTVTMSGSGFEATDQLRFNGANFASTFVNSSMHRFVSPAMAAGFYSVSLVDRFGLVGTGPDFEIKTPPAFAAAPYSPSAASTASGTAVTITGTGFESTDQLRFGGGNISSTFVSPTTRTFVSPTLGAGNYSVALADRIGVVVTGPTFELKSPPAFAATPYGPPFGPVAGGTTITITGTGFESADQLQFNGSNINSTFVNSTMRRFTSPAMSAGFYSVALVDRVGAVATGPSFEIRAAPTITNVQATAGPRIGTTQIAAGGGATIQVTGTGYASGNTVTLGGTAATISSLSSTQIVFTAPSGAFGAASLVVSDIVGQRATSSALTYVGYGDETANRQPGATGADNFTARRGAIGDLDNDGSADDLVITTNYYPGYRAVYTRIFFAQGGTLYDATYGYFPSYGVYYDRFRAQAVQVGDLDADSVQDIAIAGSPFFVYNPYSYPSYYYFEARLFTNDGSGGFSQSAYSPQKRRSDITCTDAYGSTYTVFRHNSSFHGSDATALAIGDLDGDGDAEIVMATDHYRSGNVFIRSNYVTFTPGYYYSANAGNYFYYYGTYYYTPATRIFDNQGGSGFLDVTFPRLPLCGTYPSFYPAFPGRDVKLGDIDGDANSSLDIVVTWDEPTRTSPYGQFTYGYDSSRIATKVLINDGYGFFSDQTYSWMPGGSYPEYWQGSRMELVDLDTDGMKDLVLLHAQPIGGSTSTSSLRILQNQGSGTGFVDVTSSALPSVPLSGTSDDNLRGTALAVRDADGDGNLDILVGTTEQLVTSSGGTARRTRLLRGDGALHFSAATAFLPLPSTDSGEADDLLIGDIAGNPAPSLILLTDSYPAASTNSERLRVFDWK